MAINKIIPVRLDKSSDFKRIPSTSMVDALNMIVTEDDSLGISDNVGDLGVIKNVKGNTAMQYLSAEDEPAPGEAKIIGSVTDSKLKIVYFFLWHDKANNHGVWAYDPYGKLPGYNSAPNTIRLIHKSNLYNFPEHGFVKGDIIYTAQSILQDSQKNTDEFDKDTILYFTDNKNEPKKINVSSALLNTDESYNLEDQIDFITACPRTPLHPITFEFVNDPSKGVSNFKSGPGFQFAYQFVYRDGVETAISPYSDIAFSPGIINQGTLTNVNHNAHNTCELTIPEAGEEIVSVKILAREFNNPFMVVLDQVDWDTPDEYWDPVSRKYKFYNDRIVKGVSTNEFNKQYDNLPKVAQAQAVVDNRLMYGNYLEGFDNVQTECEATVKFQDRPSEGFDFKLNLVPAISQVKDNDIQDEQDFMFGQKLGVNKCAGFILDTSDVPNFIPAYTTISVTVTFSPDKNFHLYDATNSYHQSKHRGGFAQYNENDISYPGNFTNSPLQGDIFESGFYSHQNDYQSGEEWIKQTVMANADEFIETQTPSADNDDEYLWGVPYSGDNNGLSAVNGGVNPGLKWKTKFGPNAGSEFPVLIGTSAGNPLILSGPQEGSLSFSCSFTMGANGLDTDGAGKAAVSTIVANLLTEGPEAITWSGGLESGFVDNVVLENDGKFVHEFDLGLQNGDKITRFDSENDLVCGAINANNDSIYRPPAAHFIVNKAKVVFSFEKDVYYSGLNDDREMIRLVVDEVSNVEAVTVVKKWFRNTAWTVLTKDFLSGNFTDQEFFDATSLNGATYAGLDEQDDITDFDWDYLNNSTIYYPGIVGYESYPVIQQNIDALAAMGFLGYLDFTQDGIQNNFFNYNKSIATEENPGEIELFPFSLLDGEGGPGGDLPFEGEGNYSSIVNHGGSDYRVMSSAGPNENSARQVLVAGPVFTGTINTRPYRNGQVDSNINTETLQISSYALDSETETPVVRNRSYLPLLQGLPTVGLDFLASNIDLSTTKFYSDANDVYTIEGDNTFILNFGKKHSHMEVYETITTVGGIDSLYDRTFKSSANHDFGIIYYDQRGRHGFVSFLKTVYVPGYSSSERGAQLHGRSFIELDLYHNPPEWATHYKIAYTKNTTVQNFFQYSSGGAFVKPESDELIIPDKTIYISLNYLQENPISYVGHWGARDPEGGLSMFKFIEGANQRLRVISAYVDAQNRIYPTNFEFDITDIVLLEDNEDNPLLADGENATTNPEKIGEFVVLKDNSSADGFDFQSIIQDQHYWNNNCIFELYTQKRTTEADERFYYEIDDTYEIYTSPEGDRYHAQSQYEGGLNYSRITLHKGDVWWRKVPTNFNTTGGGGFFDLIQAGSSAPNFVPYYLETETASDLFKADASTIGRPNIILEDAVEARREASITYSDQSNPNSRKINYSSFNLTLSNFKDLQQEFGDINFICNMSGDVFVVQSDRCTLVPASKTLFSDVQGIDTVAASKSPLGQERVFTGRAGCDNNPESVVQVGPYVYFAHKTLGKVFRFDPQNGVKEISDQGMASFFRDLFKKALESSQDIKGDDIRVVGGYDPVQDEYLLTVLYNQVLAIDEDVIIEEEDQNDYEGDISDITPITDLIYFGEFNGGVAAAFSQSVDFGDVERLDVNNKSETFVITNDGDQDVIIILRPRFPLKFYSGAKYPNQFNLGRYWNPAFVNIVNEQGEVQISSSSVTNSTVIPANSSHTFTININVNNANHGGLNANYWGAGAGMLPFPLQGGMTTNEEYLLERFGTTKRNLTGEERLSLANIEVNPAEIPAEYNVEFTFDAYDMDGNLLNPQFGNPTEGATLWPFWVNRMIYKVTEPLVIQGVANPAVDINNDGIVNVNDLLELLTQFGDIGDDLFADINGDGAVTVQDLLLLLSEYGQIADEVGYLQSIAPSFDIQAFGVSLANTLQNNYSIDTSSAVTYTDLISINPTITIQLLSQNYSEVYDFVYEQDDNVIISNLSLIYLNDENGEPINL